MCGGRLSFKILGLLFSALMVLLFYQNCADTFTSSTEEFMSLTGAPSANGQCKLATGKIVNKQEIAIHRIQSLEKNIKLKEILLAGQQVSIKLSSQCDSISVENLKNNFEIENLKFNRDSDFNLFTVVVKQDLNELALAELFKRHPCLYGVEPVSTNFVNFTLPNVNDPSAPQQGHLLGTGEGYAASLKIKESWDLIYTGAKAVPKTGAALVKVAVIGSDFSGMGGHADLQVNSSGGGRCANQDATCSAGYEFNLASYTGQNAANYNYYIGHEAHIAGLIAATPNNSVGVVGISPWRVGILSYQGGSDVDFANAVRKAVADGADVITMSFGFPSNLAAGNLVEAVRYAVNQGVLVILAAGNSAQGLSTEPQLSTHSYAGPTGNATGGVIVVGATEATTGALACFSNTGTGISLYAVGAQSNTNCTLASNYAAYLSYSLSQGLLSTGYELRFQGATSPSQRYVRAAGTSMSAPVAAASAALIMAYNKHNSINYTAAQIKSLLIAQSDPVTGNTALKGLNLLKAVTAATVSVSPPPPTAVTANITSPLANSNYSTADTFNFSADISNSTGVAKATFLVDGIKVAEDSSSPYAYALSGLASGSHNLKIEFFNSTNQLVASTATITVNVSGQSQLPDCP